MLVFFFGVGMIDVDILNYYGVYFGKIGYIDFIDFVRFLDFIFVFGGMFVDM